MSRSDGRGDSDEPAGDDVATPTEPPKTRLPLGPTVWTLFVIIVLILIEDWCVCNGMRLKVPVQVVIVLVATGLIAVSWWVAVDKRLDRLRRIYTEGE